MPEPEMTTEQERDDLAERLGQLLWDLTDGRLSKTNYDVRTMIQAVEATFEKYADEAAADAWDEGFTSGFYDPLAAPSTHDASESTRKNPYRAEEQTPEYLAELARLRSANATSIDTEETER